MSKYRSASTTRSPDAITLAACTWIACGCVLLGLTPLPLHAAGWGWSPLFWLLLAPASLLCGRSLSTRRLARPVIRAQSRTRAPRRRRPTACAVRTRHAAHARHLPQHPSSSAG